MNIADLLDPINKAGVIGILVFIVIGFQREWWVTGATHQRALKERDEYRDKLYFALQQLDRATGVTARATEMADSHLEAERRLRIRRREAHDDE